MSTHGRKGKLAGLVAAATLLLSTTVFAQIPAEGVKIGVMTDMSGQFSDFSGPGSVAAAEIAIEEFGGTIDGKPIVLQTFDHQNKPDVAAVGTRQWYDTGVSMIIDYPVSSTAVAAQEIAREKKRIVIFSSAGAALLSGKGCSPYGFQWLYDTNSASAALPAQLAKRGVDKFFFITADYTAGHALEADFRAAIEKNGLTTVGSVKYPLGSPDMSAYILEAMGSDAQGIVIAGAGGDMANVLKAAESFGITTSGKTIVAPAAFLTDIKGLGLQAAQNLMLVDPFYWDRDDKSRDFADRFFKKTGKMPTAPQGGVYSGVLHYLKSVKAANSIEADPVIAEMRKSPVNDAVIRDGVIRPDGRVAHDMLLVQVKTPDESKGDWDLEKVIEVLPADQTVKPLAQSECSLVAK